MRTRSMDASKSVTPKKTPPARKSAVKAALNSTDASIELATPETTNRRSSARVKKLKIDDASPITPCSSGSKLEDSAGKRRSGRTKASSSAKAKAGPKKTPKKVEEEEEKVVDDAEELVREKEQTDVENEEDREDTEPRVEGGETLMECVEAVEEEILLEKEVASNDERECRIEEDALMEEDVPVNENVKSSTDHEEAVVTKDGESTVNEAGHKKTPKLAEDVKQNVVEEEESPQKLVDDAEDLVRKKKEQTDVENEENCEVTEPRMEGEETLIEHVEAVEEEILLDKEISCNGERECRIEEDSLMEEDVPVNENVRISVDHQEAVVTKDGESNVNEGQSGDEASQTGPNKTPKSAEDVEQTAEKSPKRLVDDAIEFENEKKEQTDIVNEEDPEEIEPGMEGEEILMGHVVEAAKEEIFLEKETACNDDRECRIEEDTLMDEEVLVNESVKSSTDHEEAVVAKDGESAVNEGQCGDNASQAGPKKTPNSLEDVKQKAEKSFQRLVDDAIEFENENKEQTDVAIEEDPEEIERGMEGEEFFMGHVVEAAKEEIFLDKETAANDDRECRVEEDTLMEEEVLGNENVKSSTDHEEAVVTKDGESAGNEGQCNDKASQAGPEKTPNSTEDVKQKAQKSPQRLVDDAIEFENENNEQTDVAIEEDPEEIERGMEGEEFFMGHVVEAAKEEIFLDKETAANDDRECRVEEDTLMEEEVLGNENVKSSTDHEEAVVTKDGESAGNEGQCNDKASQAGPEKTPNSTEDVKQKAQKSPQRLVDDAIEFENENNEQTDVAIEEDPEEIECGMEGEEFFMGHVVEAAKQEIFLDKETAANDDRECRVEEDTLMEEEVLGNENVKSSTDHEEAVVTKDGESAGNEGQCNDKASQAGPEKTPNSTEDVKQKAQKSPQRLVDVVIEFENENNEQTDVAIEEDPEEIERGMEGEEFFMGHVVEAAKEEIFLDKETAANDDRECRVEEDTLMEEEVLGNENVKSSTDHEEAVVTKDGESAGNEGQCNDKASQAGPEKTPNSTEDVKQKAQKSPQRLVDDAIEFENENNEQTDVAIEEDPEEIERGMEGEEILMGHVEAAKEKILLEKGAAGNDIRECGMEEEIAMREDVPVNEKVKTSTEHEEPVVAEVGGSFVNEGQCSDKSSQELKVGYIEQMENDDDDDTKRQVDYAIVQENSEAEFKRKEEEHVVDPYDSFYEGLEDLDDRIDFGEHEDELPDEDIEDAEEETAALEEERRELTDIAKVRRIKKECEIFVHGLDMDADEEDVRKVFKKMGDVVDVRLRKSSTTNKNKGYAIVKFANNEEAKRALSEMKNPVICGKRCGTAPREENDTLFLGNVCNTWTNEAIKQKLKYYGIEGVENITLVPDAQHEELSRGFAFVEFSCNADAMLAYKRLQKPDVVFGHPERTAKVAFAEPLHEPDPAIMAKVKTVFLDSLPPHWTEDYVREQVKAYGEVVRIALARNISTAKRKDFGFVDFSTHEAAIACISGVNNAGLGDCNSKTKVRARLSNPSPKTQAVKGGICGGFLIGRDGSKTSSRFGRSFGPAGHRFHWQNFQRGSDFNQREHGRPIRLGPNIYGSDIRYAEFPPRHIATQGGMQGHFRDGYRSSRGVASARSSRHSFDGSWHGTPGTSWEQPISFRRPPFSHEPAFERPDLRRHNDDRYSYEETTHGTKRPFHMTDHRPDYVEPSRVRPRLDYTRPQGPFRDIHYRDTYGARPAGPGTYSRPAGPGAYSRPAGSGTYPRPVGGGTYSRPTGNGPYSRPTGSGTYSRPTGSGTHSLHYPVSDHGAYPPYYGPDRSHRGGYYQ